MRDLQLIPFPGDKGFALRNRRTKDVSSVIPITQKGLTGAQFPDGTTVVVNIGGDVSSAVFVSLTDQGDFFPCPNCGESHVKDAGLVVRGNTYEVLAVVSVASYPFSPRAFFGISISMMRFARRLDPRSEGTSGPPNESPADTQSASGAVDGMVEEFFDDSALVDDFDDEDSTDVEGEDSENAPASELGGDADGFVDVFGGIPQGPVDPNSLPSLGVSQDYGFDPVTGEPVDFSDRI
jgi:hypothetical protein